MSIVRSDLSWKEAERALKALASDDIDDPPGWLKPWLEHRGDTWNPAIPDTADMPNVGPADVD